MSQFDSPFIQELSPETLAHLKANTFHATDLAPLTEATNAHNTSLFQHQFLNMPNGKILGVTEIYGLSNKDILYAREFNSTTGKLDGTYASMIAMDYNDKALQIALAQSTQPREKYEKQIGEVSIYKNGVKVKQAVKYGFIKASLEKIRTYKKQQQHHDTQAELFSHHGVIHRIKKVFSPL